MVDKTTRSMESPGTSIALALSVDSVEMVHRADICSSKGTLSPRSRSLRSPRMTCHQASIRTGCLPFRPGRHASLMPLASCSSASKSRYSVKEIYTTSRTPSPTTSISRQRLRSYPPCLMENITATRVSGGFSLYVSWHRRSRTVEAVANSTASRTSSWNAVKTPIADF